MIRVEINGLDLYDEFKLITTSVSIEPASQKKYYIDVPGANGKIDYTSFFGKPVFENRTISITLMRKYDQEIAELKYKLELLFNGQKANISFSDDDDHYWKGRIAFEKNDDDKVIYELKMKIDAEPFKFLKLYDEEVK